MSQTSLAELLSLASPPVAIVDAAPPGVPHVSAVEPAGCGYWRRAAAGEVFFRFAGLGTLPALRTLVFRSRTAWLQRFQGPGTGCPR